MHTLTDPVTAASALALLLACALLHASFQLSASVMTLLSGHALGKKRSHARLLKLCGGYVLGNITSVGLLLLSATYIISALIVNTSALLWAGLALLGVVTGLVVLSSYYRNSTSSRLWIPLSAADYLYERSKRTKRSFEAFTLGLATGITELPFLAAPLLLTAMILRGNPDSTQLIAAIFYVLLACSPLLLLLALLGGGKKVSALEQWRQNNRLFLQIISGVGIIVISIYGYVTFSVDGGAQ